MKAAKDGDEIRIDDGYLYRESIREIPGRRYDGKSKTWFAPCNEENISLLRILGADIDAELIAFVEPVCNDAAEAPTERMPIKAKPYKHQVKAFNFAMSIFYEDKSNEKDI